MERTEQGVFTVLCMIYEEDKILLQDRKKPDWPGFVFPGGHVEKEESFVKAVIREMKEETGLTIVAPKICGIKQFQTQNSERYLVVLFKTNQFTGTLTSSEEGEMIWVKREELDQYPLVDDFKELLRVFDEDELNEFQYERVDGNQDVVRLY